MERKGLTVIELVTVLSIVSIISLIALPPCISWKANASLRGAAAQLTAGMQLARNHALISREYAVVRLHSDGYEIFSDNGDGGAGAGDWVRSGNEKLLYSKNYPAGVQMTSTFYSDRFRFKGFGRNQPGTVTLVGSGGRQVDIVVNVVGRLRLEYS